MLLLLLPPAVTQTWHSSPVTPGRERPDPAGPRWPLLLAVWVAFCPLSQDWAGVGWTPGNEGAVHCRAPLVREWALGAGGRKSP